MRVVNSALTLNFVGFADMFAHFIKGCGTFVLFISLYEVFDFYAVDERRRELLPIKIDALCTVETDFIL